MNAETRIREAISELESIAIHNYRATLGIERTDVRETAPYKIGRAIQGLNMALDEIKANSKQAEIKREMHEMTRKQAVGR